MVRKKSASSKVRSRKEAYKRRQQVHPHISRSWRVLIVTMKAVKRFLSFRHTAEAVSCVQNVLSISKTDLIYSNCVNRGRNIHTQDKFSNSPKKNEHFDDLKIIKDIVKKMVTRVCRLDNERKRQFEKRKKNKKSGNNANSEKSTSKLSRQSKWWKKKSSQNVLLREQQFERSRKFYRNKYKNNIAFRDKEKARSNSHISIKYHTDSNVREKIKAHSKIYCRHKYYNNTVFREKIKAKSNNVFLNKYYNSIDFRNKVKTKSKIHLLNKYHNNSNFRNQYKARAKTQVLKKYYTDNSIRLKMIQRALNSYRSNNALMARKSRQLYNQRRRILKKYATFQSHKCTFKHTNIYRENFKKFQKIIREGPDYVCLSCGLALFRNQVIPFVVEKYIKENMSYEIKKHIQSYLKYSSSTEQKWICKSCSDKIKTRQIPSRSVVNKLKVCDVPTELKELNNLEKHLIALRLPFMKIVNLTSGKLSSRFAQKGTKGPLHCVPSDVQDTVTILP
ncbi:unnamed protein product, partial [Rotaria sp. Silwood2]